jgi:hypothetical protein
LDFEFDENKLPKVEFLAALAGVADIKPESAVDKTRIVKVFVRVDFMIGLLNSVALCCQIGIVFVEQRCFNTRHLTDR